MQSRKDDLKAIAEECHKLAAMVHDEAVRLQLLGVAQHLERMADPHHPWNGLAALSRILVLASAS
jgi:hypothetical protein